MQQSWVSPNLPTYGTPPKIAFLKYFDTFKLNLPPEDDVIAKIQ